MLYLTYKISLFFLRICSRNIAYITACFLARVRYALSKRDRDLIKTNLRNTFPGASERDISSMARRLFMNFGIYLVDFFSLVKGQDGYLENAMQLNGLENIDEALKAGKGCIIMAAHFGNWELAGCALANHGYKLNVVALAHSDSRINNLFLKQRRSAGVNIIPLERAKTDCRKALKRGEALAILGDRLYGGHGIEVDLFGKKAIVPRGAALLSLKNGSPIVTTFAYKENGVNKVNFETPFLVQRGGDMDKEIAEITRRFISRLEYYIRKYPSQWYMFSRIWEES